MSILNQKNILQFSIQYPKNKIGLKTQKNQQFSIQDLHIYQVSKIEVSINDPK